jgi:hypothetical protein
MLLLECTFVCAAVAAADTTEACIAAANTAAAAAAGLEQLQLCVLDVVKTQGLVELSLLPELINMQQPAAAAAAGGSSSSKKAAKRAAADEQQQQQLAVGQEVQAMVHFIKDHYVVASIVQQQQQQQQQQRKKAKKDTAAAGSTDVQQQQHSHHGIGFIARGDFNSQGPAGREARKFAKSQVVAAKVAALPSVGNGGRLLLEVRLLCNMLLYSVSPCIFRFRQLKKKKGIRLYSSRSSSAWLP